MPPPEVLGQYDQIVSGAAKRILAMAETSATGDIKIREKLADAEIERARTGQAWAAFLTLLAIGAAIYFFVEGEQLPGGLFLSFPVVMMIRSFLPNRDGGPGDDDAPGG